MEDMLWKFPHVGQQIFKKLSNKNLAKSKKVGRTWENFIINEKFYKQKAYYETKQKVKGFFGETPLHHAVKGDRLLDCKLIIDNVEDKNPQDDDGRTPLHLAAWYGYLSIFELIFNNVKDKNPKDKNERTSLHDAAYGGNLKIFKLIFDNAFEENFSTF